MYTIILLFYNIPKIINNHDEENSLIIVRIRNDNNM